MKLVLLIFLVLLLSVQISNAQWMQVSSGMGNRDVYSLTANESTIFAGDIEFPTGGFVYKSTNEGTDWTLSLGATDQGVTSLAANGNNIFAGFGSYSYPSLYLSTNNGTNWTQSSSFFRMVYSLAVNGNNVFAGTCNNGVYLSTDNGNNWTQTSLNNQCVTALAVNGNNIFAGVYPIGVYLSTNNGTSWTLTSLSHPRILSLAIIGNNVFAGTFDPANGVYLSTNNGTSWTQTSLNNRNIITLAVNGNSIFAGTQLYGVYVSSNNGTSWIQRNEGLGYPSLNALCIFNNYIFAGSGGQSVWRRPLGELTGIQPISNEVPKTFLLLQNYPNPFNPATKIRFDIAPAVQRHAFDVHLVVYDMLGREIEKLVNEHLNAGTYEINWNASNYPSGVYYYRLSAHEVSGSSTGDPSTGSGQVFTETKKMMLVK